MRSRSEARKLCEKILDMAKADSCEVLVISQDLALTRFAGNRIHQNVSQTTSSITVRLVRDGVVGRAGTNRFEDEALADTVHRAEAACGEGRPDSGVLPPLYPQVYENVDAYDLDTARWLPGKRADVVARACEKVERVGLEVAGICTNESNLTALANSAGLFADHVGTRAEVSFTVTDGSVSGWGDSRALRITDLDAESALERAMDGCQRAASPTRLEPGSYTVILPHEAAGDFLFFMAFQVFNGLAFAEGRSPFSGRLGERLFGENITIRDDAFHPLMKGLPFDYEGMPRRAVTLVENGVARAVVHDRNSAARVHAESTGHGLPQPNPMGPVPMHLVMEGGEATLPDMIASTERGLYVTHFHYTNVTDPMRQIITGMTRDGVWLIENGQLTRPVTNLRFTESAFRAWSNVEALTAEQKNIKGGFGSGFVVPGMKIRDFTFTSSTEF